MTLKFGFGQVEAARTVGLSYLQTMRKVVLPQALRRMIPPLVNEGVTLLTFRRQSHSMRS